MNPRRQFSHTLIMVLVCLLPLFVLFALGLSGVAISPMFFLFLVVVCCAAMFYFMAGAPMREEQIEEAEIEEDKTQQYLTLAYKVADVFKSRTQYRVGNNLVAEGKLLTDPDTAYKSIKRSFEHTATTPLLQEDEAGRPTLILIPGELPATAEKTRFPWINLVLFVLTLLTAT